MYKSRLQGARRIWSITSQKLAHPRGIYDSSVGINSAIRALMPHAKISSLANHESAFGTNGIALNAITSYDENPSINRQACSVSYKSIDSALNSVVHSYVQQGWQLVTQNSLIYSIDTISWVIFLRKERG